jgi:formylglycine-generating enzyme required for sulfatase activity
MQSYPRPQRWVRAGEGAGSNNGAGQMGATEAAAGRSRIFISYRHAADEYAVGRLAEELRKHFPRDQVFEDIASIDPGADFVDALQRGLNTCAAVLVVIGPSWVTVTDRQGRRRLDLPDDWVRHEVAESLRQPGVRVFPLLLDAEMPSAEDLPEPLRPLTRRQAFPLTGRHWANDVAQLIDFLKKVPGLAASPEVEAKARPAKPASERTTPPAKSAAIDRPPAGTPPQPQPTHRDESARAGAVPVAPGTEKPPEVVKPPAQIRIGPTGTAGEPPQAKVPWKVMAALGAVVAISLVVFFTRSERPEVPNAPPPQTVSPPAPTVETSPEKTPPKAVATDARRVVVNGPKPLYAPYKAGDTFQECAECPEMVVIAAGKFEMGSPASEAGRYDDEDPAHRVGIDKAFALGRYAVTVGEFRAFTKAAGYKTEAERNVAGQGCRAWDKSDGKFDWRPGRTWDSPGFEQRDRQPVVCVSWNDAQEYVKWLTQRVGLPYRLPSEAQWEYAARAGTTTARFWGDDPNQACRYANVADQTENAGSKWTPRHECNDGYFFTAPVGSYLPNAFGLYDMLGNAWQWTEDCWHASYAGAPQDGSAWVSGGDCSLRVVRGGSWYNFPRFVRSANRNGFGASVRNGSMGFRLARTLP